MMTMPKKNSPIDTMSIKTRPLKRGNHELNDYELAKESLRAIDEYTKRYGTPPKIQPKFVEWLRDGVKYVDNQQGNFVDYKERHVLKEYADLYDQIIANTEKQNAQLSKKGAFDSKVVQTIKGESK